MSNKMFNVQHRPKLNTQHVPLLKDVLLLLNVKLSGSKERITIAFAFCGNSSRVKRESKR